MEKLNLPSYNIKLKTIGKKQKIFDILRKKYFILTPEEWVRQHFIHLLIEHLGYPASLLANEVTLHLGDKTIRADSILYDIYLKPKMIIEYKAPNIKINQSVFNQITAYNLILRVKYLVVSNGVKTYVCKIDYDSNKYIFLEEIPKYSDL